MRALQLTALEGPDALVLADIPEPGPADGMVLIDVAAAGASFPDLLITRGEYQLRPEPPFVPGIEVSGTVRSAPEGSGLAVGDQVMAATMLGGFAELAAAPALMTFPLPPGLDLAQGAGFVMNHHTAYFALSRRGRLREGEVLLVHGAAGGVGSAAVQVGKGLGARVIAAASDEAKRELALAAGADEAVDAAGGWLDEVRELTGGRGADVVFDPVGGERLQQSLRALAPEGRLLVVGFAEGSIPQIAANRLLLRNVDLVGVNWGGFLPTDPGYARATHEALAAMVASGHVRPVVGARYPLERGAEALHALAQRRATGKLVIDVRS